MIIFTVPDARGIIFIQVLKNYIGECHKAEFVVGVQNTFPPA
jgi:hypothetical protein